MTELEELLEQFKLDHGLFLGNAQIARIVEVVAFQKVAHEAALIVTALKGHSVVPKA